MDYNSNRINYWIKIDRFFAWVLFLCIISYFISGYGMTKGIIDSKLAVNIHNEILPIVIIISFTVHASYATRLALIRWGWWNKIMKVVWTIVFLMILIGFGYIEFFYVMANKNNSQAPKPTASSTVFSTPTSGTPTPTPSTLSTKTFTKEELSKYDGQNGNPPYVAVDGIVYDMSDVFKNGSHYQHIAGQELTNEFYLRHAKNEITKYPVVGNLSK
jgi:predicted heme/steroid binding protein